MFVLFRRARALPLSICPLFRRRICNRIITRFHTHTWSRFAGIRVLAVAKLTRFVGQVPTDLDKGFNRNIRAENKLQLQRSIRSANHIPNNVWLGRIRTNKKNPHRNRSFAAHNQLIVYTFFFIFVFCINRVVFCVVEYVWPMKDYMRLF